MQIYEKYEKDYIRGLEKFRKTRHIFVEKLKQLPHVCVFPTEANYVMLRLTDGYSASEITKKLLTENGILIKDLSPKMRKSGYEGEYLRIAVRNQKDNAKLCEALQSQLDR